MKYLPWAIVGFLGLLNTYQYNQRLEHEKSNLQISARWKHFEREMMRIAKSELYRSRENLTKLVSRYPFEPNRESHSVISELLKGHFKLDTADSKIKEFLIIAKKYAKNDGTFRFIR